MLRLSKGFDTDVIMKFHALLRIRSRSNMWKILCLWKLFLILSVDSSNTGDSEDLTDILTQLLEHYDIRLRPNFGADPLYIGMDITIANFNEISEVNMDYTITILLNQYWKDERLSFSTGDTVITLTGDFAEKIWVPDTFFANDKKSFLHDVTEKNKMVKIHADGSITYGMTFTTTLSCQMDLRNYPLDSQNCTVEIESYGYTVRDVVMYWNVRGVLGLDNVTLSQYTITGHDTTDRIVELATGIYQRLSLSVNFRRKSGYFIFQMYLPSILIVMLSWISFWISFDVPAARVALGITTVLTMTTINNSVRASLPRISYIKAIDVYLVVCFFFVFAALLEYAAVNFLFWAEKKVKKPKKKASATPSTLKLPPMPQFEIQKDSKGDNKRYLKKLNSWKTKFKATNLSQCWRKQETPTCSIEVKEETQPQMLVPSFSSSLSLPLAKVTRSSSFCGAAGIHDNLPRIQPKYPTVSRKRSFIRSIKKKAQAIESHLPSVKDDVGILDNLSKIIFPLTFLFFNVIYWSVYGFKA